MDGSPSVGEWRVARAVVELVVIFGLSTPNNNIISRPHGTGIPPHAGSADRRRRFPGIGGWIIASPICAGPAHDNHFGAGPEGGRCKTGGRCAIGGSSG